MRISVRDPSASGRIQLHVLVGQTPWRVTMPGQAEEALLDPERSTPGFLAEGYPAWLGELCAAIDADRVLAQQIVDEVNRRR